MKWITTAVAVAVALATNSRAEGQDVINFVSDQEGANGIRGQQQQIKSSRFKFENEKVLFDSSSSTPPLLPKKALVEKPESVGVLSDDKESIASVDHQDQTVLSVPQDVENHQVQTQRRLDAAALQAFQDRCAITSNGEGYVDCVGGFVSGTTTSQTCADACDGDCCTGASACGISGSILPDGTLNGGFTGKVCRDGSCTGAESCLGATIGSVVGPSCTDSDGIFSCSSAEIGSVDLSCNGFASCFGAKLSGVDLINSCKAKVSCQTAKANGEIDELNDCCNEENQCQSIKDGLDIVNAGCPNAPSEVPSSVPSQSSAPSSSSAPSVESSDSPSISQEPSEIPSAVPSESGKPSLVPSDSPSTSIEPSSSPTKSGKVNNEKTKTSKVNSRNMSSKSDVLAYLSSSDLSSDEKKALILMLIIGILEHFGDVNEMD